MAYIVQADLYSEGFIYDTLTDGDPRLAVERSISTYTILHYSDIRILKNIY